MVFSWFGLESYALRKMNIFHPYLAEVLGCAYLELGNALRVLSF
ncbi:hypothetical protein MKX54_17455 [Alkalihalobacillus sp. FSL R5-0424]